MMRHITLATLLFMLVGCKSMPSQSEIQEMGSANDPALFEQLKENIGRWHQLSKADKVIDHGEFQVLLSYYHNYQGSLKDVYSYVFDQDKSMLPRARGESFPMHVYYDLDAYMPIYISHGVFEKFALMQTLEGRPTISILDNLKGASVIGEAASFASKSHGPSNYYTFTGGKNLILEVAIHPRHYSLKGADAVLQVFLNGKPIQVDQVSKVMIQQKVVEASQSSEELHALTFIDGRMQMSGIDVEILPRNYGEEHAESFAVLHKSDFLNKGRNNRYVTQKAHAKRFYSQSLLVYASVMAKNRNNASAAQWERNDVVNFGKALGYSSEKIEDDLKASLAQ